VSGKRPAGAGHIYGKWGRYYGRWRTLDGRLLNRKIGSVRTPGRRDGLTRAQAEREFRRLQEAEERTPRPRRDVKPPTEIARSRLASWRAVRGGQRKRARGSGGTGKAPQRRKQ